MRKLMPIFIALILVLQAMPVFADELNFKEINPNETSVTINIDVSLPSTVEITGDGYLPEQSKVDIETSHSFILNYTDVGEYTYQIKQIPKEDGIEYDSTIYDIHVSVVRENGCLIARMSVNISGEKEKETNISFNNTKPRENELIIKKVNEDGQPLENAKLVIFNGGKIIDSWMTDGTDHKISLLNGTYTIHEEFAPEGYIKIKDFELKVTESGFSIEEIENVKLDRNILTITDLKEEKPEEPQTPPKPEEPKKPEQPNKPHTPIKTGDNTNIIIPIAVLGAAGTALLIMLLLKRKDK